MQKSPAKGGHTYVIWPESASFFGTRVRVRGTVNDHLFETSFLAMGDGNHKLPMKTEIRRSIGKSAGDTVTVRLSERLG